MDRYKLISALQFLYAMTETDNAITDEGLKHAFYRDAAASHPAGEAHTVVSDRIGAGGHEDASGDRSPGARLSP